MFSMNKVAVDNKRRRRGLTIIEMVLSLGLMAVALGGLAIMLRDAAETTRSRSTADTLERVTAAAQQYLETNFVALQPLAAGGPVRVSVAKTTVTGAVPAGPGGGLPSLQGGGFLPTSFIDVNGYQQNHAMIVRQVAGAPERLEAIVTTTGGQVIPDDLLGRIAAFVGAEGGFMATEPRAGAAGNVTGIGGGWATPAADWQAGGVGPTQGRIMTSIAFNEGSLVGDYLYRRDIGVPEANRMRTNLSLGGNDITNVTAITAESDELTIGPNISVTGYAKTGGNVEAGDSVTALNYITAGRDLVAGGSVLAAANVEAGANVAAGIDVTAGRNVMAVGDLQAARFVDNTPGAIAPDTGAPYQVDPSGKTRIHDLSSTRMNVNTTVYNEADGWEVKFFDLLPNYINKGGFIVTAGANYVPKPTCIGHGQPKITLSMVQDTMQFYPAFTWYMNDYGIANITFPNKTNIGRRYGAEHYSSLLWRVYVEGTQAIGNNWVLHAMTYCYY